MIKQTAQKLLELTEKGEYKKFNQHSRAIEDLAKLASSLASTLEALNIKSEEIKDIASDILFDIEEAQQYLEKAEGKLEAVEEELEREAEEDAAHQCYCQELFDRR